MGKPSKEHSNATKLLPRYLTGLCGNGLVYYVDSTNHYLVKGFCDFDYVVDLDKRRSLTSYFLFFVVMLQDERVVCNILLLFLQVKQSMCH